MISDSNVMWIGVFAVGIVTALLWILMLDKKRPLALPFLGHALDFQPSLALVNFLSYPAKYGPVIELFMLNVRTILVSDLVSARIVLAARPKKIRRPTGYIGQVAQTWNGLFDAHGEQWSRLRRATSPAFSSLNLKLKYETIKERFSVFATTLSYKNNEVVDFTHHAFVLAMEVLTTVGFGFDVDDKVNEYFMTTEFAARIVEMFDFAIAYLTFPLPYWLWKFTPSYRKEIVVRKSVDTITMHITNVINRRRELLRSKQIVATAMIDHMIDLQAGTTAREAMTDEEVVHNVKTIYLGGAHTSAATMSWCAYVLALYPEIAQKARDETARIIFDNNDTAKDALKAFSLDRFPELKYCRAIVNEILRLYCPASFLMFQVHDDEELQINDSIKARGKDHIWVNQEAILRDENVYKDALSFNPDRWMLPENPTEEQLRNLMQMEASLISFGGGARICPGMQLATIETIMCVAVLSYSFDIKLGCPKDEIKRILVFTSNANKMPLRFVTRKGVVW